MAAGVDESRRTAALAAYAAIWACVKGDERELAALLRDTGSLKIIAEICARCTADLLLRLQELAGEDPAGMLDGVTRAIIMLDYRSG